MLAVLAELAMLAVLRMLAKLLVLAVLAVPGQGPVGGKGRQFFLRIINHFIKGLFRNLENLCF